MGIFGKWPFLDSLQRIPKRLAFDRATTIAKPLPKLPSGGLNRLMFPYGVRGIVMPSPPGTNPTDVASMIHAKT